MPVVQMTVQIVAGAKNLGAASASVQFTRSIGAALGTALVGAVLFAVLAAQDPQAAALFADVVERGPQVLDNVSAAVRSGAVGRGGGRVPGRVPDARGVQRRRDGAGLVAADAAAVSAGKPSPQPSPGGRGELTGRLFLVGGEFNQA